MHTQHRHKLLNICPSVLAIVMGCDIHIACMIMNNGLIRTLMGVVRHSIVNGSLDENSVGLAVPIASVGPKMFRAPMLVPLMRVKIRYTRLMH